MFETHILFKYTYETHVFIHKRSHIVHQSRKAVTVSISRWLLMPKHTFRSQYLRFNLLTEQIKTFIAERVNPLTAKLFNLNFHPLEVVKLLRFDKMEVNCFQLLLIDVTFYL